MIDIRLPASGFRRFLFGMFSGLPVFTGISVTYSSYQDSSLPLRMTAAGGERVIWYVFRTAGIYWRLCHLQFLPRFFADAQNDCCGRKKKYL